jgi:hypothetical protein
MTSNRSAGVDEIPAWPRAIDAAALSDASKQPSRGIPASPSHARGFHIGIRLGLETRDANHYPESGENPSKIEKTSA